MSLLERNREYVRELIKEAMKGSAGAAWNDVGVLLFDTTNDDGRRFVSSLPEGRWSDDGRLVSFVVARQDLVEGLPTFIEVDSRVREICGSMGALVLCIEKQGIGRLECVPANPHARSVLQAFWNGLDPLIERALAITPEATWADMGVIVGDTCDPYVRDLLASVDGVAIGGEPCAHAVVMTKQHLLDVMTRHGSLDELIAELSRLPTGAFVLSAAGPLDLVAATKLETIAPPTEEDLREVIASYVASGRAASWDAVGIHVIDTRSPSGRAIVEDISSDRTASLDQPWVVIAMSRLTLEQVLAARGAPDRSREKGALVVLHSAADEMVIVHVKKLAQH